MNNKQHAARSTKKKKIRTRRFPCTKSEKNLQRVSRTKIRFHKVPRIKKISMQWFPGKRLASRREKSFTCFTKRKINVQQVSRTKIWTQKVPQIEISTLQVRWKKQFHEEKNPCTNFTKKKKQRVSFTNKNQHTTSSTNKNQHKRCSYDLYGVALDFYIFTSWFLWVSPNF